MVVSGSQPRMACCDSRAGGSRASGLCGLEADIGQTIDRSAQIGLYEGALRCLGPDLVKDDQSIGYRLITHVVPFPDRAVPARLLPYDVALP